MSLTISDIWLKMDNLFKGIYGFTSRQRWTFQQHIFLSFLLKNPYEKKPNQTKLKQTKNCKKPNIIHCH